jgi:uncharacterized membrane protein YfcA
MHLTLVNLPLLLIAGFVGGIMNAVAGGGTFLIFPAMVFLGIPSVAANQTSTIAVFPGQVASLWAYRKILAAERRIVLVLGLTSLLGGSLGAIVLIQTANSAFDRLVPWLLLFATVLFAFGNTIRKRLGWRAGKSTIESKTSWSSLLKVAAIQLVIGLYGGFFGAGAGILELAVLDVLGFDNIHLANALKVILTTAFNVLALVIFITLGKIFWPEAFITAAASIAGGYGGAWVAQRLPESSVRRFVLFVGITMTVYLFARAA